MMSFDDFQYNNINQFIFDIKVKEELSNKKKKKNDQSESSDSE